MGEDPPGQPDDGAPDPRLVQGLGDGGGDPGRRAGGPPTRIRGRTRPHPGCVYMESEGLECVSVGSGEGPRRQVRGPPPLGPLLPDPPRGHAQEGGQGRGSRPFAPRLAPRGFEQTASAAPKTRFSENSGTNSGTVGNDSASADRLGQDPDLAKVVAAWPSLTRETRQAILDLVAGKQEGRPQI